LQTNTLLKIGLVELKKKVCCPNRDKISRKLFKPQTHGCWPKNERRPKDLETSNQSIVQGGKLYTNSELGGIWKYVLELEPSLNTNRVLLL